MKILSICTSSDICGVSILEDTNLICKLDANTGRTHSENLMQMIDEAFKQSNLKPTDIELIVCDIGPGSFTGIRIGVATAKALSDSLNIPCVGISSLEALAFEAMFLKADPENINEVKYVCSMLDCKNDNCYFALYEKQDDDLFVLIEPQAESVESALAILDSYSQDTLDSAHITFVGDGAILNSEALGLAGLSRFSSCEDLEELLPLYLKKPQAQRQLEEKESNI